MIKQILYLAFIVLIFAGCEEIYNPSIDNVQGQLVVDARLTNDSTQNFVKLTLTRNYYSKDGVQPAMGAKVSLIQVGGGTQQAAEGDPGYYTFAQTPVPGQTYMLRIQYKNNNYESSKVKMPLLPTIDTLYTPTIIDKQYVLDAFGKPQLDETPGRNVCIDAPISEDLKYYRFSFRAVLLWQFTPANPLAPMWFGWLSVLDRTSFNLAGPKDFSVSDKIQNHKIIFLANDMQIYVDSVEQAPQGWILIMDEYGTTKESYDFHQQMNQQFSADGSLFDPINTQIYSNIHCTNDKSKIVLGFFDLNSYRQYRYFLVLRSRDVECVQRRLNRYPNIPEQGYLIGYRPSFWESRY